MKHKYLFIANQKFKKRIFHLLFCSIATFSIFPELPAVAIDLTMESDDPVLLWNDAALKAITNTNPGPTPTSRSLGMLHTSIYDAWSAYDPVAISTQVKNNFQVSSDMNTLENKRESISYAAYNTLVDLFPTQKSRFNNLMNRLGYDYTITSTDTNTAVGLGNFVAQTLVNFRHQDSLNQLNGYADTTGYQPVNSWDRVKDPNYWQPLSIDNGETIQQFLTPHWGKGSAFALTSGNQFLPPAPAEFGTQKYVEQALQVIEYSAELTDEQKVIAEYWADGPQTVLPPGHWNLFGQFVSLRDGLTLDENVKLFFALGNAVFDAGIAAWDAKEYYDYVRPFTAIRYLASNNLLPTEHPYVRTNSETGVQEIFAWGSPNQGSQWIDGSNWLPYQNITFVTPPFAEYVSGHSAFSAAAAEVLRQFTGNDYFGACHTQPANSSTFESNTPAEIVKLCWDTFSAAADEAGISRLYGGIHFQDGDLNGRTMGRKVGAAVWNKAQFYIDGGKSAQDIPEGTSLLSLLAFAGLSGAKRRIKP